MINWIEFMGCIAGVLTSFAFIPQIIKLLKTKQSIGISVITYCCTLIGCSIWFIYGLFLQSLALILFNFINIITTLIVIVLSIKYQPLLGKKP